MFTLQILDRGQTLYFAPDAGETSLGSAPDAGIRLTEAGVEARHARLLGTATGLMLVADADVVVNGAVTRRHELALGDRIEIGRAVIVVGQARSRPAEPEDVFATPRVRVQRPAPARSRKLPLLVVGAAALLIGGLAFLTSGDGAAVADALNDLAKTRQSGDLTKAQRLIARYRAEWAMAKDDRLVRLDAEDARVAAVVQAVARLEARVLEPGSGGYSFWLQELQRLEAGADAEERTAAHIVRGSLRATIDRRPPMPAGVTAEPQPGQADSAEPVATPAAPTQPAVDPVPAALADAERLVGQGLFAQAAAMLLAEIGQSQDGDAVSRLEACRAQVLDAAEGALRRLLADTEEQQKAGLAQDALNALVMAQHRFPPGDRFAGLATARQRLAGVVAAAAARPAAVQPVALAVPQPPVDDAAARAAAEAKAAAESLRQSTLSMLRVQLDKVRDAEAGGRFTDAEKLLTEAADLARPRDPDYAGRLLARAGEMHVLAACGDAIAAAVAAGRRPKCVLKSGEEAEITGVDGAQFLRGESPRFCWQDVTPQGITMLVDQLGAAGDFGLGAATLLYRAEEPAKAETVLAALLRAEPQRKRDVDGVLARGRNEVLDERGYVLGKTGFVSARSVELAKEADRIAQRADTLLRGKDLAARQKFVDELLAHGPDHAGAIVQGFQKELAAQIDRIEKSNLRKQVDRLGEQRAELDKARQYAKDLIYDEVRYFYPYKPPAVSGEKFAEYNRVQQEVDNRVDAVRKLWNDDRLKVKVPASLRADLDGLDWCAGVLGSLGGLDPAELARIDWARALPPGDAIGIVDFCLTSAERDELVEWRRIEAYDAIVGKRLSSAQRELLRITNEYRAMFRHRPLAVSVVVCNAAQGHADEMGKLGYFSHFSPTPGRRSPYDRMKLAGYNFGVSENIALNGSAMGAHVSWLHSSGHHRNLLNPTHREIGIGAGGNLWVQNFGGGSTWTDTDDWKATAPK